MLERRQKCTLVESQPSFWKRLKTLLVRSLRLRVNPIFAVGTKRLLEDRTSPRVRTKRRNRVLAPSKGGYFGFAPNRNSGK